MVITEQYAREQFCYFNNLCFGGELPLVPIVVTGAGTYLGKLCYKRVRTLFRTARNKDFQLRFSNHFDLPETELQDVVLHEMIHLYIAVKGIADKSAHGPMFRVMMNRLNEQYGRNMTISHKMSGVQKVNMRQFDEHYVCVTEFESGLVGLTVCSAASVPRVRLGVKRYTCIKKQSWYKSDNNFFNKYPHSRTGRIFKVDVSELQQALKDATYFYF